MSILDHGTVVREHLQSTLHEKRVSCACHGSVQLGGCLSDSPPTTMIVHHWLWMGPKSGWVGPRFPPIPPIVTQQSYAPSSTNRLISSAFMAPSASVIHEPAHGPERHPPGPVRAVQRQRSHHPSFFSDWFTNYCPLSDPRPSMVPHPNCCAVVSPLKFYVRIFCLHFIS